MSQDLRDQLRAYGRILEEQNQLPDESTAPTDPRPQRVWRGRLWPIGALAAVVVTVVLLPILLTADDSGPSTTSPTFLSPPAAREVLFSQGLSDFAIYRGLPGEEPRLVEGVIGSCPSLSPDGTMLAVFQHPEVQGFQTTKLVVFAYSDGVVGEEILRVGASRRNFCMSWAPDSQRVAYGIDNPGWWAATSDGTANQFFLNVVNLAGDELTVSAGFNSHFSYSWSPDGTAIALTASGVRIPGGLPDGDTFGEDDVWLIPANGGSPIVVDGSGPLGGGLSPLAWAPDSSAFAARDGQSIRVISADGGSNDALPTVGSTHDWDRVVWSPDGQTLAYFDHDTEQLTLVPRNGGPVRALPIDDARLGSPWEDVLYWDEDGIVVLIGRDQGQDARILEVAIEL